MNPHKPEPQSGALPTSATVTVADERFELPTSPYESDVITYFTNQQYELYRGIEPRYPIYKTGASPFMLIELVVENIGLEPIRIPCKGISFPISLIPHCSRYENRTHIIGVKVLYPTPFRRTDHLRRYLDSNQD